MINFDFTVLKKTNTERETFDTNDFKRALAKFEEYLEDVRAWRENEYKIVIVDNHSGEKCKYIEYYDKEL